MNRTSTAIIVALTDPTPSLAANLARFAAEAGAGGEVVLVDASGTEHASILAGPFANVRVLRRPVGLLAPELWRDGLRATGADLVALTTASMAPALGWLEALTARMRETGAVGVGGPIGPGLGLSAVNRAVALLRYSGYFPEPAEERPLRLPLPLGEGRGEGRGATGEVEHATIPGPVGGATPLTPGPSPGGRGEADPIQPPGDNALYRRSALLAVESSWVDGFWEVEVHPALIARGGTLAMASSAVVAFTGGGGLARVAGQRFRHARRYGAGRASGLGFLARSGRVAASPLVPPLLCGRGFRALRARGMAWGPWLVAVPALVGLATAWAAGEAVGTLVTPRMGGVA